ncbi:MAG TPA: response regulator [Desulfobacterales bacterium]|nr:response regulator [Desulfobacterales bacterium]
MKKALIVEDNPDNLRLMTYILQREDYEILSAEDGEQGVQIAADTKLDLIIMDIMLPGIDGMESTRRIRASEPEGNKGNPPIIAMTSYAMRGDREKILAAGCNGYIEKPVDPLRVMTEIKKIIQKEKI